MTKHLQDPLIQLYPPKIAPQLDLDTQQAFSFIFSSMPTDEPDTDSPAAITDMRTQLGNLLDEHGLKAPEDIGNTLFDTQLKIGPLTCSAYHQAHAPQVPTLVMFSGGGFCFDNSVPHQAFMAHVAKALKFQCHIAIPDCPLAPEASAGDILAMTHQFMQSLSQDPCAFGLSNDIRLLGWSSGATLALSAALSCQENSKAYAHLNQLILLSPWVDLTLDAVKNGPYQAQQNLDTAAGYNVLSQLRDAYLCDIPATDPLVSPLHQPAHALAQLPKTTLIAGEYDALIADAIYTAWQLKSCDCSVDLEIVPELTHNYMVFSGLGGDRVAHQVARLINAKKAQPTSINIQH